MSIQQTPRFGAQQARVLHFPKFAATLPPVYEKGINVRLDSGRGDAFAKETPQHARIVLTPKTTCHVDKLSQEAQHAPNGLETLAKLLKQQLLGVEAEKEPATEVAFIETQDVPARSSLTVKFDNGKVNRKATTEAIEQKTQATARHNTNALLNAFEEKLDTLGEGVTEVSAVLPRPLPAGVKADSLLRDMARIATNKGYNYRYFRADNKIRTALETVTLGRIGATGNNAPARAIRKGQVLGHAMNLTRHLVDSPANHATAAYVANQAKKLAENSDTLKVNVMDVAALEGTDPNSDNKKRMGLFLSVAQGNAPGEAHDPKLVEMVHTPKDWDPATGRTVVLVGKGIIFDTGGNDLKPTEYQHNMRGDMAGAAAVLGTMKALEDLPVGGNVRVVAMLPLTENRISASAQLEQDIQTARSGFTAEITSTDAEGRLVLADAMNYALEKYPNAAAAFTIATLTGAKTLAVGEENAIGIMGNNRELMKAVDSVIGGELRRTTAVEHLSQKYHDMVTQKGQGPSDGINASRGRHMLHAGVYEDVTGLSVQVKEDLKGAIAAKNQAKIRGLLNTNPALAKVHYTAGMADGGAFIQSHGMVAMERAADGSVSAVKPYKTPWAHLDIASAEFGPMDPKRGNHEWATGIGVEDLYLTLEGIASGKIEPDADKTELPNFNHQ